MAHMFIPSLSYAAIFRFWPVILIALGVEVLLAQGRSEKVEFFYDGWAMVMMVLLILLHVPGSSGGIHFLPAGRNIREGKNKDGKQDKLDRKVPVRYNILALQRRIWRNWQTRQI